MNTIEPKEYCPTCKKITTTVLIPRIGATECRCKICHHLLEIILDDED